MLWIYVNGDVSVTNINCVPWVTCSINNKIRGMIKYLVLYSTCINTYDPHTVFIHTSNITSNFESLISLLNIIYCTTNIAPIPQSFMAWLILCFLMNRILLIQEFFVDYLYQVILLSNSCWKVLWENMIYFTFQVPLRSLTITLMYLCYQEVQHECLILPQRTPIYGVPH